MSIVGWIIAAGGTVAATILLWPASGTRLSLRSAPRRRSLRIPVEPVAATAAAAAAVSAGLSAVHAASVGVCAVVAVAALKILVVSRRWTNSAEGVARLAGVLANQATVATTVADAVARAAPLVSGPVGDAADTLASDCRTVGVDIATERFATRVPSSAARSLADLIAVSAAGGGRWAETVDILETEATDAAATARLFHSKVAALMPTVALIIVLSAGLVAGTALVSRDVAAWLAGPTGGLLLLGASLVSAAVASRVVLPARAVARSGGRR